jgi:hypothetical protein
MLTAPAPRVAWWISTLVLPIAFTFVGAAIGLASTLFRDKILASRKKRGFLIAVHSELNSLDRQLCNALEDLKLLDDDIFPQSAATFSTGVYSTQIGKLDDVNQPLILEVIRVYSLLGELKELSDRVNVHSDRCNDCRDQLDSATDETLSTVQQLLGKKGAAIDRLRREVQIYEHSLTYVRSEVQALAAKLPVQN